LGLRDNVQCLSWAHWKARSGLPVSVNGTFSLAVTNASMSEKRSKVGDLAPTRQRGRFDPKFLVKRVDPPIIFARIVKPMNNLQLCR